MADHHGQSFVRREDCIEDTFLPNQDQANDDHSEGSPREMWKGRHFCDRESFRNTLKKFAMYNNFFLKHLKTSTMEVSARCDDKNCSWCIYATMVEGGPHFQVKKYNGSHTCSKPMMGLSHCQATLELIATFIKERLRLHNNYTAKEIMFDFQLEFGFTVSYRKAWEKAMLDIRGSYEESFAILSDYCQEVQQSNPSTITHLLKEDDDSFDRFFWAFGSCIDSFKASLIPLIAVDGCHLRRKYPSQLFSAVTYDGNHKLFRLAFAITEFKNRESWEWFFVELDLAFGPFENLTIVSDRQKGLIPAIQNRFPKAYHCYCCKHILDNLLSRFKVVGIVAKFWCAAKELRPFEYERHTENIKKILQEAYRYIEDIIGQVHLSWDVDMT